MVNFNCWGGGHRKRPPPSKVSMWYVYIFWIVSYLWIYFFSKCASHMYVLLCFSTNFMPNNCLNFSFFCSLMKKSVNSLRQLKTEHFFGIFFSQDHARYPLVSSSRLRSLFTFTVTSLPITVQEIRDRLGKIRDQVARMYTVVNSRF